MRFGKPLDFSRYEGMENDRYILRAITDEIMYEIMQLSGQEYVDMYATKAKELSQKSAAEAKRAEREAATSGGGRRAEAGVLRRPPGRLGCGSRPGRPSRPRSRSRTGCTAGWRCSASCCVANAVGLNIYRGGFEHPVGGALPARPCMVRVDAA